ncbi:aminotransferase class V [Cellulomonas flavigena DSM 20109]|uniref:Aminotransferase class V n=1 Tax=Cellulomonas flavigena (strain ATCC 482 / DSM 20109 / BCRC 11376 / JCM 18109 / NBRC 3775 / NCIMB 8073 / NRS 134) TaxID=446466 RepID=D5UL73_CELFN|nr:aminotransferase class V-fold PLP-dependent enzyme [Cellulomonas flavigena]ADG75955.1 aminotransferase class V [Cellulomonas flavigena DSM 20109]
MPPALLSPADLRARFSPTSGHLDAATCGLPLTATTDALRAALDEWAAGEAYATAYDRSVAAARTAYARLAGVDVGRVAIAAQASTGVGLVAAALPDGARVVVPEGDFTSVTYPFLAHADRGVNVRAVPLERLADAVAEGCDAVATSLVQSRDGRVADLAAVRAAADDVGALRLVDVTQAAGWLPLEPAPDGPEVTVCAAYKWLCAPRGTAFLTVTPEAGERLRPLSAGWYAGDDPWASVYGTDMRLAADARRFDTSPAWLAWVGAVPALETFAQADVPAVRAHDAGLADALRDRVGMPPVGSAIVSLPDDEEGSTRARLTAAGLRVAGRGGGVRLAFHVWNDEADVERVVAALGVRP